MAAPAETSAILLNRANNKNVEKQLLFRVFVQYKHVLARVIRM
ncbi:hypothetical protein B0G66_12812 [Bacillus badius]|nr:hypothetical protein B0G66_12812 [Bacillus badius]